MHGRRLETSLLQYFRRVPDESRLFNILCVYILHVVCFCICMHYVCTQVDGSGEIIRLEPQCPWVEHLFAVEDKLTISPNIKYVLYQEKESEKWRVQVS